MWHVKCPEIYILACDCKVIGSWHYSDVCTPYWRFYYAFGEGAKIISGGKTINLTPERFALVPPDVPFSSRCHNFSLKQFFVHFTLQGNIEVSQRTVNISPLPDGLSNLIMKAAICMPDDSARQIILLQAIIGLGISCLPQESYKCPFQGYSPATRRAIDFMKLHLAANPDNGEIARILNMPRHHFIREFTREVGVPPQTWLKKTRLDKACLLLHFSDKTIKEIAAETGYYDRYHFSKTFKAERGMSPVEFRRKREK
ncbi:MAG: AraC family transcriptional regulator [Victivallales bacterium]